MKFRGSEEQTVTRGSWNYVASQGAGTITLSYAPAGEFKLVNTGSITDGVITGDATDIISLPTCRFTATLTGDATFEMYKA